MRSFAVLLVSVDHTTFATGHTLWGRWKIVGIGIFGVYLFCAHVPGAVFGIDPLAILATCVA